MTRTASEWWGEIRTRVEKRDLRARTVRFIFGDRRGLALFLGSLCFIGLLTRVGIFITDTFTTANAFVALTEGHLAIEAATYGPSLDTPGMHIVDGDYYGRNYGQLVLSLPVYWLLKGVSLVADLRIALVATWSLTLLSFSMVVGRLLAFRRAFTLGGSGLALVFFVGNVAVATPISDAIVPVLAMQLTGVIAGALVGVFAYRLVAFLTTPRVGVFAGVFVLLGTPIGLWAPIPKRHVFTTLCVLVALFAFAKSRDPDTTHRNLVHGGAYAATGLLAWIHAPEALVLFTALVLADIVSSRPARYRALPTVIGVFVLSLLPFFVTNLLIAGNPFVPPRLLRTFEVPAQAGGGNGGGAVDPGGGNGGGSSDPTNGDQPRSGDGGGGGKPSLLTRVFDALTAVSGTFVTLLLDGVNTAQTRSTEVFRTFVRSGYIVSNSAASDEAINLSVLESAPVLGGLVAPLAAAVRRSMSGFDVRRLRQPGPATAIAMGLFVVLFSLVYLRRLPIHAQVTVRYLLPLYAIGVVGVVWLAPIRRVCQTQVRAFTWTVATGVLIGGQVAAVFVISSGLAIGEAFQFHALVGLGLAGVLAASSTVTAYTERFDRVVAVALGLTTSATVVFSMLVVTTYANRIGTYPIDGGHLFPLLRLIAEILGAS